MTMPSPDTSCRAVFLDKDGTLIEDIPFGVDPAAMRLMRHAANGLRALSEAGYRLIVVSNQSGVARGFFSEEALIPVERRLRELLARFGVALAGFLYCPHWPEGVVENYRRDCACRKPAPGLLHEAARRFHINLAQSWMVGDILDDVEAGRRAGCRTILICNGHETEWQRGPHRSPDYQAAHLNAAAAIILQADRRAYAPRGEEQDERIVL
jgi:D-glycero-D-manno-heptose 1,7-bisphosphate phosphatase